MRKTLVALVMMVFAMSALVGCRAEVDPDGDVSSNVVAPR